MPKTVGVMGSSSESYPELARSVGELAARLGCHLLTGGGDGVMAEASRAFCAIRPRKGLCIGVMKGRVVRSGKRRRQRLHYVASPPNRWVELPIFTHLPLSGETHCLTVDVVVQ